MKTLNYGGSDDWSAGPSVALILTGCDPFHRLKVLVAGNNCYNTSKI